MHSLLRTLLIIALTVFAMASESTILFASPTAEFISTAHIHTGAGWLAEIDLTGAFQDGPLIPPSRPWYDGLLSNGFVRVLLFGGILGLLKIAVGYTFKSSTPPPPDRPATLPPPPASTSRLPASTSPAIVPMQPQPAISISPAPGQWLYQSNNQEIGPFDENSLRQMRNAGVITSSTRIRRTDGGSWINYADVFGS